MLKCPKCKNQYKDNITYCVFCGLDLVPVEEDSGRDVEESNFPERITENPKRSSSKISPGSPPLSLVFPWWAVSPMPFISGRKNSVWFMDLFRQGHVFRACYPCCWG
jgi:hypothetical protein